MSTEIGVEVRVARRLGVTQRIKDTTHLEAAALELMLHVKFEERC